MGLVMQNTADRSVTVYIEGELSFSQHTKFQNILMSIDSGLINSVYIDLSNTHYIDSSGLGMLLLLKEKAESLYATSHIRGARGQVRQVLDLSRFGDLFEMVD